LVEGIDKLRNKKSI